eukprot:CAMPEP_0185036734 /NCGR_PEP_ID=MMETSP1103-20130426/30106_1 /TAXON_ID=36769 /ORGANISM="Paraphysomonas bandaiensis, Strain Caron Lab Isolate" /LENGTH=881 /DNA_ID=CAMNT_0027574385 /DNA_START=71 /DNA_END=2716 /DNA_ORIENTATION=+
MTIEEKIGQMVQIDINYFMSDTIEGQVDYNKFTELMSMYHIGSVLNSPFSGGSINGEVGWTAQQWRNVISNLQDIAENTSNYPILFGLDSIHGASYVYGSTLFPQQISVAASFNTKHAYNVGKVGAKDTRAAGVPWMFSPVLGLALHPLWPRFYETFGEDPYLAAEMGRALVNGIQEVTFDGSTPIRAAACMKHFIAYSMPSNGHDRSPVQLSDRSMKQLYLPAFQAAVDAGVLTAMESYNDFGGVPMVSSYDYLTKLIRYDMNFTGMLVTDYAEIENLHTWHKVSSTQKEAVELALTDTTIDMSMVPLDTSFFTYTLELVNEGVISESRIDDSVRRILKLKDTLGLLESPLLDKDDPLVSTVGQDVDRETALEAARESITLLKNVNLTLPIPAASMVGKNILVTGPTCDSLTRQTGGWSFHWQGATNDSEFLDGVTVKSGIENEYLQSMVHYVPGPDIDATNLDDVNMTDILDLAENSEFVVVCVGEETYTEKPGDINDLNLAQGQVEFVNAITAATSTPVVLVLISGRPRLLNGIADISSAVLEAYLPGPYGGTAIADIISGNISPSGRLPFTYPKKHGAIPYPYHHKPSDQCESGSCEVEWEFGSGMTYSSFLVSDVTLSSSTLDETGSITISATVTNIGAVASNYSVLVFLFDVYRRVSPEYKLLKRFSKVDLAPAEFVTLSWTLTASEDLKFIGLDGWYILESGEYAVGIGSETDCREDSSASCPKFTLSLSESYNPVCSYACDIWSKGVCGKTVDGTTCDSSCRTDNWTWNYLECLQDAVIDKCGNWQCYDAFATSSTSTNTLNGSTSCGNDNMEYTDDDMVYATIISALAGLAIGIVVTWMSLFTRSYVKQSSESVPDSSTVSTTQSPMAQRSA